jgi:hypothetical protein
MDFMDMSKKWMNESSVDQKQAQNNNYLKDNFNVFLSLFWKKFQPLLSFPHFSCSNGNGSNIYPIHSIIFKNEISPKCQTKSIRGIFFHNIPVFLIT